MPTIATKAVTLDLTAPGPIGGATPAAGTFTGLTLTTNPVLLPAGSAAAPVVSFSGQTNLGFFKSGVYGIGVASGGNHYFNFDGTQGIGIGYGAGLVWSAASAGDLPDLKLTRDAANTLAQRNGVNAQTSRIYNTYTDASNYERLAISGSAITVETAGTGADDIDLALTPAGAGTLKFGTHSAWTAEVISGYITIKDAAGNSRKLAVIS